MASDPSSSSRFFVLQVPAPGNEDTEFHAPDRTMGDAPECPQCKAALGMRAWLPPYRGEIQLHGERFGDFVRAPGNEYLMTERMAEAFRQEGLRGLSGFAPVECTGVRQKGRRPALTPPKYLCVTPNLWSAAVDEARSQIRRSKPFTCTYCRSAGVDAVDGLAIEEGSWNGDDLFRPRGSTGGLVVSERFERFVSQHGFTNMLFTPSETYSFDFYPPRTPSTDPKASS